MNGTQDEFNLLCIRCACVMSIYLLARCALIEANEAVQEILARGIIILLTTRPSITTIIGEKVLQSRVLQLFGEKINLVEEEDDARLDEPSRVANRVEEGEGFLHTVDRAVFVQHLVVFGEGDEEDEGGDVFETVDPFLTFGSLTADVK